LAFLLSAESRS